MDVCKMKAANTPPTDLKSRSKIEGKKIRPLHTPRCQRALIPKAMQAFLSINRYAVRINLGTPSSIKTLSLIQTEKAFSGT